MHSIRGLFQFLFRINDRVISANNISLEGVDYATAVQVLRDSGQSVNLVVKRRLVLPPNNTNGTNSNGVHSSSNSTSPNNPSLKVSLIKANKKKDEFGLVLGCKIYIKQIINTSLADREENLSEGDILNTINGISLDGMSLKEAKKVVESFKDRLDLVITKFQNSSTDHAHDTPSANHNGAEDKPIANGHSTAINNEYTKEPESLKDNNHNGELR